MLVANKIHIHFHAVLKEITFTLVFSMCLTVWFQTELNRGFFCGCTSERRCWDCQFRYVWIKGDI